MEEKQEQKEDLQEEHQDQEQQLEDEQEEYKEEHIEVIPYSPLMLQIRNELIELAKSFNDNWD